MPEQKITAGQRLSPRTASSFSVSWWRVWITTSVSLVHDFIGASLCSLTLAVATFIFACVCILLWFTDLWNSCCFARVWVPFLVEQIAHGGDTFTLNCYTLCSSEWFGPWQITKYVIIYFSTSCIEHFGVHPTDCWDLNLLLSHNIIIRIMIWHYMCPVLAFENPPIRAHSKALTFQDCDIYHLIWLSHMQVTTRKLNETFPIETR